MFSSYKSVFWICAVMTVFFYVPFYPTGFSTDVWMRMVRVMEWAAADFPWKEHLMMAQNFPSGVELHWTRPMDWIGYILAWPFIPEWGLHHALEIMAWFMPPLCLVIGVRGYFYALKGYVTPKAAFLAFWLFFYTQGYIWGQANIGYFDHHVVHFTILMWVFALTCRGFLVKRNGMLMAMAGALTGLGVWITPEFLINVAFIILPYGFFWLVKGYSLKPVLAYLSSMSGIMLAALCFDHPIAGFGTLDLYRFSLIHIIIGVLALSLTALLETLTHYLKMGFKRRLIYAVLAFVSFVVIMICAFSDILLVPMTNPFIYHMWVKKVEEMLPLYKDTAKFLKYLPFGIFLVIGAVALFVRWFPSKKTPALFMCACGLLFYLGILIEHVRVGVSVDVFLILTASFLFYALFYPREKSRTLVGIALVFYAFFIAMVIRGPALVIRFRNWGVQYYWESYQNNPDIHIPDWLREGFEKKKAAEALQNQKNSLPMTSDEEEQVIQELFESKKEDERFSCNFIPERGIELLKENTSNGSILTDIFTAPEIAWRTAKPIWGGPYHTVNQAHVELLGTFFDQTPSFEQARRFIMERQSQTAILLHPRCAAYLFYDAAKRKMRTDLDQIFYYTVYYETPEMPSWIQRIWYDEGTGVKIFKITLPEQPQNAS